jgi:hypothetical protein
LHCRRGVCVIDIVEDQEPAWISFEPAECCVDLFLVIRRVFLRKVEDGRTDKSGKVAV